MTYLETNSIVGQAEEPKHKEETCNENEPQGFAGGHASGGDRPKIGHQSGISQDVAQTGDEETQGRTGGQTSRFDDCPGEGTAFRASEYTEGDGVTIRELQQRAWQTSEDHGFHEFPDVGVPTRLMLMVSEISEAMEEDRGGQKPFVTYFKESHTKPEGVPTELADVVIRIMDFAETYGFDLQDAILRKMDYNDSRQYKHGGKAY